MAAKKQPQLGGPIGQGAIAGAASGWASRALGPTFGPAAATGAVGYYTGNETLQTMAGFGLGRQLMSDAPGVGGIELL